MTSGRQACYLDSLAGTSRPTLPTWLEPTSGCWEDRRQARSVGSTPMGTTPTADAGARRSAVDLRADVAQSFEMLEAAWDGLDAALWDREACFRCRVTSSHSVTPLGPAPQHHRRPLRVRDVRR